MDTEEQLLYNVSLQLYAGEYYKQGQKLTIPNRRVVKLGLWLAKFGTPTGDVTFGIETLLEAMIVSKVLGNASALTTDATYYEVTFDTPVVVNEEVYLYASFNHGQAIHHVKLFHQTSDVKADECYSRYKNSWVDVATYDGAYIYTYGEEPPAHKSANMGAKMMARGLM